MNVAELAVDARPLEAVAFPLLSDPRSQVVPLAVRGEDIVFEGVAALEFDSGPHHHRQEPGAEGLVLLIHDRAFGVEFRPFALDALDEPPPLILQKPLPFHLSGDPTGLTTLA